ncbi:bacillithiol biosynthesis cysteine-adding enzyme BshC [Aquimarina brevivitae]|uniref:Putative cysteine ligase BshC n=1 Tax=Aquimarina brevivitae TaxID=323412 RepID=A0A4Q7PKC9_9FLAO|nr:bacillithiol biosynthesis cysteine-adding enzyme BshC [Aquimarina brevivitae]RZT00311.1 bacillithiol biosynthesis cysteine-adding enzyme BshC [Aquimarina brevivitae]
MSTESIPFRDTNYFSSLLCDYLDEKEQLQSCYDNFPHLANFKDQIDAKGKSFSLENRAVLVQVLQKQYRKIETTKKVNANIDSLGASNTFTITTGHQLNLFTGPLYFLYKIISTINLCKTLKEEYKDQNFIPVYWMATEDHDFDEIKYFNLYGKKIQWNRTSQGPVGRLTTKGLDKVYEIFAAEIGVGKNADYLKALFKKAYLESATLAEATRYIANELFGVHGLVVIDADDKDVKNLFVPYMQKELLQGTTVKAIEPTIKTLQKSGYNIQVNPRDINLFYITDTLRERIIKKENTFYVNDTEIVWQETELIKELHENPERFSPNVLLRPLYQEVMLPNLCYIGGGGELAYWLELKELFVEMEVPLPILLLRNSALLQTAKQSKKMVKLGVTTQDLFLKQHELINKKVRQISNIDIDFGPQKEHLQQQFQDLYALAEQTDASFINAVKAQEVKQLKGLANLEQRLLKAQRLKLSDQVARLTSLQNELFPNQNLQERVKNFSEFYLEYGEDLIAELMEYLHPLNAEFVVLTN